MTFEITSVIGTAGWLSRIQATGNMGVPLARASMGVADAFGSWDDAVAFLTAGAIDAPEFIPTGDVKYAGGRNTSFIAVNAVSREL